MKQYIEIISKILTYFLVFALVFTILGKYKIRTLPDSEQISSLLTKEPEQTSTSKDNFQFRYGGQDYFIEPVYDYEISGLIVTHNDISSITDAYHTSKSVDIKDLCLVWGNNVKDNVHKKLKFWSEAWTCNVQANDNESWSKFNGEQLSNNHLLSNNSFVREKIKQAKIGDVVKFSGMLVNYRPTLYPDMMRKSSTVRTDTGNGACEVVFVNDFQIVKEWQPTWSKVFNVSKKMLILAVVLKVLSFILLPYLEYRLS